MSFQKILVAINESPEAEIVFDKALELAKRDSASLMVLNCIELGAKLTHLSEIEVKTEKAEKLLQTYQEKIKGQVIPIEFSHKVGQAGQCICNLAQSWQADLIVVGRRGFKGLTEVLLGSVSNHVVHNAPCSVLVLQGESLSN